LKKNKIVGKEINLKKRPAGFVTEDDFELVEVEIPEIKNEGEFLVRNIWMSVDPFMRIYMTKGTKIMSPAPLNKALNGGCIGQVIESKSDKFRVATMSRPTLVGESTGFLKTYTALIKTLLPKSIPKLRLYNTS
jgi:NADPH-dependent curcumin reductase CurA